MKNFVFIFCFLIAGGLLSATEQTSTPSNIAAEPAITAPEEANLPPQTGPATEADYKIEVGDELDIKSFFNPELNDRAIVRPDGKIALQMIGEVDALSKTSNQLAGEITQQYAKFYRKPETTVMIRSFGGRRVYVSGEVVKPQVVQLLSNMTALQAISAAEGFTGGAKATDVVLIRRKQDGTPDVRVLNLKEAMLGKDMSQDVKLQSFDILCVPRTKVSNVNDFIAKYFRNNIPIPLGFSLHP